MTDKAHLATITAPSAEVQRMHPVVQAALAQSPDPATLRELLAVQREWEAGEAKKAFTRALIALKRDMPAVLNRDKTVDFATSKGRTTYTHTTLGAAMDAVHEPMERHGFSVSWLPSSTDRAVTVTCRLTHVDGHSEETSLTAPIDTSGNKSPAQGVASTSTLLQRYTFLAILGLVTADMTEPEPREPRAEGIDAKRNMAAAGAIKKRGLSMANAEELCGGRTVQNWTAQDLDTIREWLKQVKPASREMGDDVGEEEINPGG